MRARAVVRWRPFWYSFPDMADTGPRQRAHGATSSSASREATATRSPSSTTATPVSCSAWRGASCENDAAAEEVLQEVFWQVWQDAGHYDPRRGSPEAWLVMRAQTRTIDRLRSMRRRERTFVAPLDEGVARADPAGRENPATLAEDRGLVQGALGRLPDPQRRVIEMAFFEGLTQAEIAARLGEPLGTVKTRARAGLERLRQFLVGGEQAAR